MTDAKTVLQRLHDSLHILQERQAKHGLDVPPKLIHEIEDHESAIALTEQLATGRLTETAWREQLQPLLVTIEARKATEEISALDIGGVRFSDISGSTINVGSIDASIHAGGDIIIHNYPPPSAVLKTGRRDYYAHINLPPNFVPRPELLDAIKQTLLTDSQTVALTSALKLSALHGMGGIGKSVLARALCDESDVQATFTDGILWTTLGQSVSDDDLKAKLRVWIETLGGIISLNVPTLEQLKNSLAEQLKARACLLIVDDMWRHPDAAWFNAGGPNCRLLLTTRDAEAARQLGATVAPISTMQEQEAISLLAQWAGRPLDQSHSKQAAQIVKRLGYLPLALKLAGEQLRRKEPTAWLAGFKAQKLKSRRDESVHGNLFDTFALSLTVLTAEEQQLYTSLVIFKEDESILLPAIVMLWSQLADYEPDQSEDYLFDLAERALLHLSDDKETVILHDLVREFMAEQLPAEGQRQAHTSLLAGYRTTQSGAGWATAPDDGYLYRHLAYHLDTLAVGDETAAKDLHHLFADDAWLQVRVAADGYRYDGYLADLELAWQRAKQATRKQIAVGQEPEGMGNLVHYALIQGSINALAGQYPPALVAQAVTTKQWTVARAISVAANIVDPKAWAEMCMALLPLNVVQPGEHRQLSHIALAAAQAIGNEGSRAKALTGLALHLSGEAQEAVLVQALAAAQAIDYERDRASALSGLVRQLSGAAQEAALAQALEAAQAIGDEGYRAKVLSGLAPQLSGEAQETVLAQALAAAQAIGDERSRAEALTGLAPQLSGALLTEALAAAQAIGEEKDRVKALTGLVPHLSGDTQEAVLAQALAAAQAIGDEGDRAYALTGLAPHLNGETQEVISAQALTAAQAIGGEWWRAMALFGLIPHLSGELLTQALAAVQGISNEFLRADALTRLVPPLSEGLLNQALTAAQAIGDEWPRAYALSGLVPHLSGETQEAILAQALTAAQAIGNEEHRADVLTELASYLSGGLLAQALAAAQAIGDEADQAYALSGLAPHLSGETQEAVLIQALAAAQAIDDEADRAIALAGLAPHLSGEAQEAVLVQALAAAQAIGDEGYRAYALTRLARHLRGELLAHVLAAAQAIGDEAYWASVLTELAPHLSEELLNQALAAAQAIGDEGARAKALTGLVPHLSEETQEAVLAQALAAVQAIGDEGDRVWLLTGLVPHLSSETQEAVLAEALAAVQAIGDEWPLVWAVTGLVPHLSGETQEAVLAQALAAVQAIGEEEDRAYALTKLAPYLSGELLAQALAAVQAIDDEEYRAKALGGLVPHLSGRLLNQALAAAQAIGAGGDRAYALNGLAPHLSPITIMKLVMDELGQRRQANRSRVLYLIGQNKLFNCEKLGLSVDTMAAISRSIVDICTKWRWL